MAPKLAKFRISTPYGGWVHVTLKEGQSVAWLKDKASDLIGQRLAEIRTAGGCLLQDDWGVEIIKTVRQKEARLANAAKAWLNLEKTRKEAAAAEKAWLNLEKAVKKAAAGRSQTQPDAGRRSSRRR